MGRLDNHHDSAPAEGHVNSPMKGFDPEFVDIVDYILRITYRIWEGKQVGLCHDYYSQDCPVYTLAGITIGAEEVTQATLNTLAAYPDRTLNADNIIWGGDDESGFHTSHLISTEMTNEGDSEYGPATGKHAKIQVIAHCIVKDNRIIEEWLVRDNYSLVEQLGLDPYEIAQQQANADIQPRLQEWMNSQFERLENLDNTKRISAQSEHDQEIVLANLNNIWSARMVGDVKQMYTDNAILHASANRELKGHQAIEQFYLSFMGTFSNIKMSLDYNCHISNTLGGNDIAVRWTMSGEHTGRKLFGEPTGASILIIGESQYRMQDGKVMEEWTVFDQLAIQTQIERARQQTG